MEITNNKDCTNPGCISTICCCCFPLPTGILIIGIIDLINGAYNFYIGIQLIGWATSDFVTIDGYYYDSWSTWVYIIFFSIFFGIFIFVMGVYGVMAGTQNSLPHAIRFHRMRTAYLVWTCLYFLWSIVYVFIVYGFFVFRTVAFSFLIFVIPIYWWIISNSFVTLLRSMEGGGYASTAQGEQQVVVTMGGAPAAIIMQPPVAQPYAQQQQPYAQQPMQTQGQPMVQGYAPQPVAQVYAQKPVAQAYAQPPVAQAYVQPPVAQAYAQPVQPVVVKIV